MLTIYKAPHTRTAGDSTSHAEKAPVIPAGQPYITKVNGRLVMARGKKDKHAVIALDLLGEAFEGMARVVRKRSQPLKKTTAPLFIGETPYVQSQSQTPYTVPIPHNSFSNSLMQYTPQGPTFAIPNPSHKDLDQLNRIVPHFNAMVTAGYMPPKPANNIKEEFVATTITVTKHVCGQCGRLRSRKYHHDHPIKAGEKLEPAFCRKCQRDASSTSSDCSRERRCYKKKEKKKEKRSKKRKKCKRPCEKRIESSSEDESSSSESESCGKPKEPSKKNHRASSEDYILVDEGISDGKCHQQRGRTRTKLFTGENAQQPLPLRSPARQLSEVRELSAGKSNRYDMPGRLARPLTVREVITEESIRRRSPSIQYRYVEIIPDQDRVVEAQEGSYIRKTPACFHGATINDTYNQKLSNHSIDRNINESNASQREQHLSERLAAATEAVSSGKEYSVEEPESISRGSPSKKSSFEGREAPDSSRYFSEAKSRIRGRRAAVKPDKHPWRHPHEIHPRHGDDLIVVTETFEYRPRKLYSEEQRRRQEFVDRATLDARYRTREFSIEEAAKYYGEDWSRNEYEHATESRPIRKRASRAKGYRRERYLDSEIYASEIDASEMDASEIDASEVSRGDKRTGYYTMPRAPTPPSPIHRNSTGESWQNGPSYPSSSKSNLGRSSETRQRRHQSHTKISPPYDPSRVQPFYVRDSSTASTERSLRSSLRPSREQTPERFDNVSLSDWTDQERVFESNTKRVTFRETPSEQSANEWTTVEDSIETMEEQRTGSGWNDDAPRELWRGADWDGDVHDSF